MKHLNPQHFNNNQLKEVADPTQNSDAATKGYVDAGQRIYFGVCNTAGNVADKVVTAPGYTPAEGKILVVKFNDAVRCFDAITQTWIHLTMNVNNTGALYLETYTYDYEYPDGDTRWYDLLDGEFYAAFQYYEISTEDKGYRLIGTTGTFEMIRNLFDRLNSHSQILSDLEQPAPIFYGITNTAEATATKAVTLINPSDGFVNGSFLLLHFTYAVPAGSDNAISVDGVSYGLTYHQYGVTSSGVVNSGDKVLLYCYNYVAHIVAIDRWGTDIQGKQDALPDITNNAGKALVVNDGETGFVWKKLGYTYISHNVDATMHDPLTLTCTEQTHHHVVMGPGMNGLNLIVDVHNNFENVITVDFTEARTNLAPSLFITVYKDGNPVSKLASSCSSYGGNVEKMHYPSMPAVYYQLYATSNNSVNHLYLKISAAALGAATYGIVHATPMLCSDLTLTAKNEQNSDQLQVAYVNMGKKKR